MNNEYYYPDVNDKITIALIKEKEPFPGYWEESERKILNLIKSEIEKYSDGTILSWLLDAGCGTGRLLPEFQRFFRNILAIDPDSSQIDETRKLVKSHGFLDKVMFKVVPTELLEWKKESIDVVLCSHVIQHVETETVPKILRKLHDVLKPNGLLFILTTHSRQNHDYYMKDILKGTNAIELKIEKEEFDSLIRNQECILPLHFFSVNTISELLKETGFTLLDFRSFHILDGPGLVDKIVDRDEITNRFDRSKRKFGRDALFICKKQIK